MADEADLGNESVEQLIAISLGNRVVYQGESAEECEDCCAPIPQARRLAVPGVQLCIGCAERNEALAKSRLRR
ncbi:hypothetical protein D3C78_1358270 [compost metagenome]